MRTNRWAQPSAHNGVGRDNDEYTFPTGPELTQQRLGPPSATNSRAGLAVLAGYGHLLPEGKNLRSQIDLGSEECAHSRDVASNEIDYGSTFLAPTRTPAHKLRYQNVSC